MGTNRIIPADMALENAITRRLPVVVTHRDERGWHTHRTRFLKALNAQRLVVAERLIPVSERATTPQVGDAVAVAFRIGSCKIVFSARCSQPPTDVDQSVTYLTIPDQANKVNRRAFQRTAVPPDCTVPVRMWCIAKANTLTADDRRIIDARLIDLSLGGACIETNIHAHIDNNATYRCVMIHPQSMTPIAVDVRPLHRKLIGHERVYVGLQFFGVEAPQDDVDSAAGIGRLVGILNDHEARVKPRRI